MADYEILTTSDAEKWNQYLSMLPVEQQDVYFTPEYYKLYENNGDGIAYCFVFKDHNNLALYPFLMNRINDLGYDLDDEYYDIQGAYGYNGVIASSQDNEFISKFYKFFNFFAKKNNIICEFTRFHPLLNNVEFSKNFLSISYDRYTIALKLNVPYEEIFTKYYSGNNRNMLRKANKSIMRIDIGNTSEYYKKFVNIYYETMDKVNAEREYYFSEQYFNSFNILLSDNSFVIMLFDGFEYIAGGLFLQYGIYTHYHLSGRSSLCSLNFASNIIIDSAVKYSQEKNCSFIHLGGGRTNNENDSLLKFKRNFSPYKYNFYIGKAIHNINIYNSIISQWKEKYPLAADKYANWVQGYRYQF